MEATSEPRDFCIIQQVRGTVILPHGALKVKYQVSQFSTRSGGHRKKKNNYNKHQQQKSSRYYGHYFQAASIFFASLAYIIIKDKLMTEDKEEEKLPDEVDWCSKGAVSPVVDQQQLGSHRLLFAVYRYYIAWIE